MKTRKGLGSTWLLGAALLLASARMASAVSATGGNVTNIGGYAIHTFTNSGTFAVTAGGNVEVLVVAGGGGGGARNAGGGGAGGVITTSSFFVASASNYAVTVGGGGAGNTNFAANVNGGQGSNSVFDTLIAFGGGYGGGISNGGAGGSGGGGNGGLAAPGQPGGSGTVGQGFAGGSGAGQWAGGGGGGAGGAGVNGNGAGNIGTAGGIGVTNNITGSWVWYAGGGGGGTYVGTVGAGGSGIGGNGGKTGSGPEGSGPAATAGAANTGSGGGGGGKGGNGGSGIVVIRYVTVVPVISNLAATNITTTSATLQGYLSATGLSTTAVSVYWGTNDGGTNRAAWNHTNDFGVSGLGPLSTNVGFAVSNVTYYYSYCATNANGSVWAGASMNFVAGAVTVAATTPAASEIGPTPGVFTVTRPAGATNEALAVNYTVSGSASNGVDYSSLGGTATIAAGQSNAAIVVTPILDELLEGTETVRVTLASGAYVVGSPSNAEVTIADAPLPNYVAKSSNDFSNVQGSNGWYYGYYQSDVMGGTFIQLSNYIAASHIWAMTNVVVWPGIAPLLSPDGAHPSMSSPKYAVRRWVSTVSGTIVISGQWGDNDPTAGDGVLCTIRSPAGLLLSHDVTNGAAIVSYAVTTTVAIADALDFVVDAKVNDANDSTKFTAIIVLLAQQTPVIANTSATNVTSWTAGLNGYLSNTGAAPTTVFVYWGPTDGGTNAGAWTNTITFASPASVGLFSTNISLSAPDGIFYYRYCATNAYGVVWAGSAVSFVPAPSYNVHATGGTITNIQNCRIHTFTNSGTFTVQAGGNVEVLVVAGGGGGGSRNAGGGGAGGLIYTPSFGVLPGTYPVTVGAGGAGAKNSTSNLDGLCGSNSVFSTLIAFGGGYGGGSATNGAGGTGGSGGGGAAPNLAGGAATNGQGWAGGTGAGQWGGGGGGGAGGPGINGGGVGNYGTAGGAGVTNSISGQSVWYAGGGGGGTYNGTIGLGGSGIGGNGGITSPNTNATVGVANTGSGGGGGGIGGDGGSGIVIVRYALTPPGTVFKMR